jgi:hypothetical protein
MPVKKHKLVAVDSIVFKLDVSEADKENGVSFHNYEQNDSCMVSYISTQDTCITIQSLIPYSDNKRKITLTNTFNFEINSYPNSYYATNDTFVLFYSAIGKVVFINYQGEILATHYVKKSNPSDVFANDNEIPIVYKNGILYLSRTITDVKYPSYIYPQCNQLFSVQNDTFRDVGFMGLYPNNYGREYIHLTNYSRLFTPNSVYYGFESSDSIFKVDYNNICTNRGILHSDYKKGIDLFDTQKHGDISYIIKHCILNERNLFYAFSKEDNLLYCVKRLKRNDNKETKMTSLICLDTNLNKQFEILLQDKPITDNILFFRNSFIYSGSFKNSKLIKYKIDAQ